MPVKNFSFAESDKVFMFCDTAVFSISDSLALLFISSLIFSVFYFYRFIISGIILDSVKYIV